ncbi:alpha/beta hydrolase-fold protein [Actinomyces capricornis]|uniref:Acyl-CoA:diacylglycerol acyltransferase n=1 Tax=Actinomyces capricornis TaxID=2755559 RepID=A0ABM7U815_9ACTO|nr:alpha/beta hydrolase-fold protein [Actinomyces capricornis]BDA63573.1 hypothetical protein MANAM107_04070 [Actinomyces capricornis]
MSTSTPSAPGLPDGRPHPSRPPRRHVLALSLASASAAALAACGQGSSSAASSAASAPGPSQGATGTGAAATEPAATMEASASPTLEELAATVPGLFRQAAYEDAQTSKTLPYNIYLPEGYEASGESYPLVLYIADSSLAGQEVTAPLGQYGALIWAAPSEQARHKAIVVVPAYPEVVLDDHDGYTLTDYVEMSQRLVASLVEEYPVDRARVYGTGQSMGCMTVMYLAAQHADLFTALMLVSGQWDPSQLQGLTGQDFWYFAAAGDSRASQGQEDVRALLDSASVPYASATWDATWSDEQTRGAAEELLAQDQDHLFVSFEEGTVLSANPVSEMEHMASFEPAYKVGAAREWLMGRRRG